MGRELVLGGSVAHPLLLCPADSLGIPVVFLDVGKVGGIFRFAARNVI